MLYTRAGTRRVCSTNVYYVFLIRLESRNYRLVDNIISTYHDVWLRKFSSVQLNGMVICCINWSAIIVTMYSATVFGDYFSQQCHSCYDNIKHNQFLCWLKYYILFLSETVEWNKFNKSITKTDINIIYSIGTTLLAKSLNHQYRNWTTFLASYLSMVTYIIGCALYVF